MTLKFSWDWESASGVRASELQATWSSLQIDVGDVTATLVEERGTRSGLRRRINVPTYPLAESIAYNWWRIFAPTHRHGSAFVMREAGDGFPWPEMTLSAGPGYILAELRRADRERESVRFLTEAKVLLSPSLTEYELRRFVEDTIQQLEQAGVSKTPLQEEWAAIASADDEVSAFCRTAAALDLDPYNLSDDETRTVLSFGEGIEDAWLLAELAASTRKSDAKKAREWLKEALTQVESAGSSPEVELPFKALPLGRWERPWSIGYERARRVRESLGLGPDQRLPVDELVKVAQVRQELPNGIAGLAGPRTSGAVLAVGSQTSHHARRFTAARAIGRRTFDDSAGGVLLTSRNDFAAKLERAFAAELLAPAAGIKMLLNESNTDQSICDASKRYEVSTIVIQHQLENQIDDAFSY